MASDPDWAAVIRHWIANQDRDAAQPRPAGQKPETPSTEKPDDGG